MNVVLEFKLISPPFNLISPNVSTTGGALANDTWDLKLLFFVRNEWAWQMCLKSLFCRSQPSFVEKLVVEKNIYKRGKFDLDHCAQWKMEQLCFVPYSSSSVLRLICLLMNKSGKNGKRKFYSWMKLMMMYI